MRSGVDNLFFLSFLVSFHLFRVDIYSIPYIMAARPLRSLLVHTLKRTPARCPLHQVTPEHLARALPPQRRQLSSSAPCRKVSPNAPADAAELPILPRPLGVIDPPSTASKTWQEKKEELLDRERHLAKRKAL